MAIQRNIHTIDASGKTPGRLSTQIATLLIGKNKPSYQPNIDAGDKVKVVHASEMKFTGKKLDQKKYYHHTHYAGGLREKLMRHVFEKDASEVLRRSVSRMLPKNKLRNERMKRLDISN